MVLSNVFRCGRSLLQGIGWQATALQQRYLKFGVCGVWDKGGGKYEMTPDTTKWDKEVKGAIDKHLKTVWPHMKLGTAQRLVVPDVAVLGLANIGPKDVGNKDNQDQYRENVRCGMGAAELLLNDYWTSDAQYKYDESCKAVDAGKEGVILSWYEYDRHKIVKNQSPTIHADEPIGCAYAQNFARLLCDTPPNKLKPADIIPHLNMVHKEYDCVTHLAVHDRNWIVQQKMEGFLTVANSSSTPPMFAELIYDAADRKGTAKIVVVAAGLTFQSGGLCPPWTRTGAQLDRPVSMSAVNVALGTIWALCMQKVKVNVNFLFPLCENSISGQCLKVGDEIYVGGKTVKVNHTGLEGHVLAADALVYGQKEYKPPFVVNLSSMSAGNAEELTGGAAFGCFTNSDKGWECLEKAGADSGERPWRLPLWDYYNDELTDTRGTLNINDLNACMSGAFIKNFLHGDWMHLDISGQTWINPQARAPPYFETQYPTGRPMRCLYYFLKEVAAGKFLS